jgi:hypothetical protein
MDQHEKRARELRAAPGSRSTAPAGTPYPVAPNPASVAPAPSESQPRTVGGHTARLAVPEGEEPPFDPLGSSSLPVDLDDPHALGALGLIGAPPPDSPALGPAVPLDGLAPDPPSPGLGPLPEADEPASSRTVGGTARLLTVSPEEAAAAKHEEARKQSAQKAARTSPAPFLTTGTEGSARSGSAAGAGSSTLALLLAPASVTVGLIFFAMGSMLTLTVEGRLIRLTIPAPIVVPAAPPPSAPPVVSTVTAAIPPPVTAAAVVAPSPASHTKSAVPSGPPVPPATPHSQGGTKLPQLPFVPQ